VRAVAVGGEIFVAAFRIAGLRGIVARNGREALRLLEDLASDTGVALILVSDEFGPEFSERVKQLGSMLTRPVVYLLPRPGGEVTEVDYRAMLRGILGI